MKIFDYADLRRKRSWDYTELGITPEDEGIAPIADVDNIIEVGDSLIINNIAYTVCSMSGKGLYIQCGLRSKDEKSVCLY